ncbi:MAG: tryptophan 2,3-dioxygenase [Acidimicrobiia bacterium]
MSPPEAAGYERAVSYSSYLRLDELLGLQHPRSEGPEHDEMLFIVIHQTYELWFKSILHELARAQRTLGAGDVHASLATLGRVRTILKVLVAQVDILETMTPLQFLTFRDRLDASSGFQSAQFREMEAVLGRRDPATTSHLAPGGADRARVEAALSRPALWDSVLALLAARGHPVPAAALGRDVRAAYEPSDDVQAALERAYRGDPEVALLLERLVDVDEGLQEWRYRHVKMVERTIGSRRGTGGSAGAEYLVGTLFRPVFPDLWAVRARF